MANQCPFCMCTFGSTTTNQEIIQTSNSDQLRCGEGEINFGRYCETERETGEQRACAKKNPLDFKCTECGRIFDRNGDATRHMLVHTGKRAFACETCSKTFKLKGELKRHLITHSKSSRYSCSFGNCQKTFGLKGNLDRHIRSVHSREKRSLCNICGKSFSQSGDLNRHLLIHNGDRKFECLFSECDKKFTQKAHLEAHKLTHQCTK